MSNANLNAANRAKNDEFYTMYEDIENELQHYPGVFQGKTVYCNCDNPEWSNFWRYFHENFTALGLKKVSFNSLREGRSPVQDGVRGRE